MKNRKDWHYRVYEAKPFEGGNAIPEVVIKKTLGPKAKLVVPERHIGMRITLIISTFDELEAYRAAYKHQIMMGIRNEEIFRMLHALEELREAREKFETDVDDPKAYHVYEEDEGPIQVNWASTDKLLRYYPSPTQAAHELGIKRKNIMKVLNGEKYSHKRLTFKRSSDKNQVDNGEAMEAI